MVNQYLRCRPRRGLNVDSGPLPMRRVRLSAPCTRGSASCSSLWNKRHGFRWPKPRHRTGPNAAEPRGHDSRTKRHSPDCRAHRRLARESPIPGRFPGGSRASGVPDLRAARGRGRFGTAYHLPSVCGGRGYGIALSGASPEPLPLPGSRLDGSRGLNRCFSRTRTHSVPSFREPTHPTRGNFCTNTNIPAVFKDPRGWLSI